VGVIRFRQNNIDRFRRSKAGKKIKVLLKILCKRFDEVKSGDIPNFLKQISQNIRKRSFISE
jgi:hypothetical protein